MRNLPEVPIGCALRQRHVRAACRIADDRSIHQAEPREAAVAIDASEKHARVGFEIASAPGRRARGASGFDSTSTRQWFCEHDVIDGLGAADAQHRRVRQRAGCRRDLLPLDVVDRFMPAQIEYAGHPERSGRSVAHADGRRGCKLSVHGRIHAQAGCSIVTERFNHPLRHHQRHRLE